MLAYTQGDDNNRNFEVAFPHLIFKLRKILKILIKYINFQLVTRNLWY